jgi:hypothetical protein
MTAVALSASTRVGSSARVIARPSDRMRAVLAPFLPELTRVARQFWGHPHLAALYPRYLAALHTVIRASVPLMQDALQVTQERWLHAPEGPLLAAYLDKHIGEEMWHDDWLLEDLERLGLPRSAATKHIPSPAVAAMVGAQYYHIRHVHPAVFLGYIAVLEGYPPSEDLAKFAADRTGYPIEAFRTLRKHAHLDPQHCRDLNGAIDSLPLDDTLQSLIRANGIQTLDYLIQLVQEIIDGSLSSRLEYQLA